MPKFVVDVLKRCVPARYLRDDKDAEETNGSAGKMNHTTNGGPNAIMVTKIERLQHKLEEVEAENKKLNKQIAALSEKVNWEGGCTDPFMDVVMEDGKKKNK